MTENIVKNTTNNKSAKIQKIHKNNKKPIRKDKQDNAKDYSPALGKTIQRLRKAYNMSLGELSEHSGVAKSIISQIERNETNPTLGTVWRLTQALDTTMEEVLKSDNNPAFIELATKSAIPHLISEDGLCNLLIIGSLDLVEFVQWYDFRAKCGGVLESEPHPIGSSEHLSVLEGELTIEVNGETKTAKSGETLRYRGDLPHKITNSGSIPAHATMVLIQRPMVIE